jgi:hypothetical protein
VPHRRDYVGVVDLFPLNHPGLEQVQQDSRDGGVFVGNLKFGLELANGDGKRLNRWRRNDVAGPCGGCQVFANHLSAYPESCPVTFQIAQPDPRRFIIRQESSNKSEYWYRQRWHYRESAS